MDQRKDRQGTKPEREGGRKAKAKRKERAGSLKKERLKDWVG